MADSLDSLAKKGRASQAQRLAKQSKPKQAPADPDAPDRILARSIRGRDQVVWSLVMTMATVLLSIVPPLFFGSSILGLGLMTVLLLAGTFLSIWTMKRQSREEHRWLRELPFEFDLEAYFEAMSRKEFHGVLVLKVKIALPKMDPEGDGYRGQVQGLREMTQKVEAALNLGEPAVVTRHKDQAFTIKSPKFDTWFVGDDSVHSNHQLHGWFRAYGDAVLLPLHKAVGIRSVTIQAADA